jgi:hypothetical protein
MKYQLLAVLLAVLSQMMLTAQKTQLTYARTRSHLEGERMNGAELSMFTQTGKLFSSGFRIASNKSRAGSYSPLDFYQAHIGTRFVWNPKHTRFELGLEQGFTAIFDTNWSIYELLVPYNECCFPIVPKAFLHRANVYPGMYAHIDPQFRVWRDLYLQSGFGLTWYATNHVQIGWLQMLDFRVGLGLRY